jgi:ubiquinone/menaquinone biosynthesis C-methylase UbiE
MFSVFGRRDHSSFKLVAGMVGVKMGDRVVQIGCANGGRLAAVAAHVGLSGRAVAIAPDDASAARARKGAAQAGVLIEVETAPPTRLPLDDGVFDVAIVDDTGGLFAVMRAEDRVAAVRELLRILRPGGRVMVLAAAARGGIGALVAIVTGARSGPPFDPTPSLRADGFGAVRRLAEREGLVFVEALKPRVT